MQMLKTILLLFIKCKTITPSVFIRIKSGTSIKEPTAQFSVLTSFTALNCRKVHFCLRLVMYADTDTHTHMHAHAHPFFSSSCVLRSQCQTGNLTGLNVTRSVSITRYNSLESQTLHTSTN